MEVNQIIHGDCLEVMKSFEDKSVDLALTSPPYNIGNNRKSSFKVLRYNEYNDNLPKQEYFEWIKKVINELLRVTKYHVFLNIYEFQPIKGIVKYFYDNFNDNLKETFIWYKPNPQPAVNNLGQLTYGFEYIFCFSHDNPETKKFSYHNLKPRNFISTAINLGVNQRNQWT